jgi:thioredoxin-like negative regulator of GroEL
MANPISVQLVTAPGCSKCEQVKAAIKDALGQLHGEYPIDLQELNLPDHPEITDQYEIWATPALIINGELAFSGRVNEQALRDKLAAASQSARIAT